MGKLLIPTPNKDVVCSWTYTWARQQAMSIHEYRIILRTIEIISAQMEGKRLKDFMYKITPTVDTYSITLAVKDVFYRNMKQDEIIKEMTALNDRKFSVLDPVNNEWWSCRFIEYPRINFGKGTISYAIYKPFAKVLLDFTQGYRKFELNKALALPTTYAMRFYMIVSGGGNPIDMTIDQFKKWLGIENEDYIDKKTGKHRIDHIEERVIKPAQKALDESCPWTFSYEKIKKTSHPRSAVTGFRFYPIERKKNRDEALERASLISKLTTKNAVGDFLNVWLQGELGWPKKSVDSNKKNIDIAFKVLGQEKTIKIMKELVERWNKLNELDPDQYPSQIRYVMGTLKKQIKEVDHEAFIIKEKKNLPSIFDDLPY